MEMGECIGNNELMMVMYGKAWSYRELAASFGDRLKIIGLDPLVGHDEASAHEFDQVGLAPAHLQSPLLLLLQVPLAHLLATHQHESVVSASQQTIVVALVRLFLLHQQFEVSVVEQEGAFLLHEQPVAEGMHEGYCHLKLVDLLQTILGAGVNLVNCELLSSQSKQLIAAAKLHLQDVATELIVANLLGAEVEQGHLGPCLWSLPEEIVHIWCLRESEGEDAVEGVQLDGVELASSQNFPLLDLLLFILNKRPPPKDMLFQLCLALLVQDEEHALVCSHNGRIYIDAVLQLQYCLFGHFFVL